jgi:phosphohistidine phosphatase
VPYRRMKRRLIIMRHAKSDWHSGAQSDHERPLNERGRQDAPAVAERIAAAGWTPSVVYSSDSRRTRETFDGLGLDDGVGVLFTRSLYHADLGDIMASAAEWDDRSAGPVLVLGHNPGWEDAVTDLTGVTVQMTTANAALLEGFGESWVEALSGRWRLIELIRSKEL